MIIVRCSHCRGLMKVDDSRLPADEPGKARCPHCGRICPADPRQDLSDQFRTASEAAQQDAVKSSVPPAEPDKESAPGPPKRSAGAAQAPRDENDFLFPAEQGRQNSHKRSLSTGGRVILWAALSLFVMAFFALLVNVMLPGPPERSLGTGISQREAAPASVLDSRVRNDRRATDEASGNRRR